MIKITALRDTKFSSKSMRKIGLLLLFGSIIGACSSNVGRNVDLATQNAERAATQQALARAAQQKEQQRALEEEREREEIEIARIRQEEAEKAKLEAERQRLAESEQRRFEVEQRQRAEEIAAQLRRQEMEALVAVTAERDGKLARISELENQLNEIQLEVNNNDEAISALQSAISAAEELLEMLTEEQEKYEDIDEAGFPRTPLAKELLSELESRRDMLTREAISR